MSQNADHIINIQASCTFISRVHCELCQADIYRAHGNLTVGDIAQQRLSNSAMETPVVVYF